MSQKGPLSSSELLLYQYPGDAGLDSISPPCLKIHLALRRMQLPYFVVDLKSPFAVKQVTPAGRVPVLQVGERRIGDSVAILDALEEMHPDRPLGPTDPASRTLDRLWEHFANDTLYWQGFFLRWCVPRHADRLLERLFAKDDWSGRLAGEYMLLPLLRSRAKGHGIGGRTEDEVMRDFNRALGLVESGLAGGPFLQGRAEPGRGDIAVATLLAQTGLHDTMPDVLAAVHARPAVSAHVGRTFAACRTNAPPGFPQG